jgi:GT2 family glycosyltransferase
MRVLAHIHTFNDADIIDATIEAVRRQTRPVDGILVVDNASIDGTLDRPSLRHATVLRHQENLGTSGTVISGMRFAFEHEYDWIWVFDADSAPAPDALQVLLDFYSGVPPEKEEEIACLACLPYNQVDGQPWHGSLVSRFGRVIIDPPALPRHYPFHVTAWSGALYRLAAVRRIGLPNPDYVLDWGEYEYGYRVTKAGYKSLIHQDAVMRHNVRGSQSLQPFRLTLRPFAITFYENPPIRCYYVCRNTLYFTLYEYDDKRASFLRAALWRVRPAPGRPGLMRGVVWQMLIFVMNFLVRPVSHAAQTGACVRGIWHGLTGNIAKRY